MVQEAQERHAGKLRITRGPPGQVTASLNSLHSLTATVSSSGKCGTYVSIAFPMFQLYGSFILAIACMDEARSEAGLSCDFSISLLLSSGVFLRRLPLQHTTRPTTSVGNITVGTLRPSPSPPHV
jgi:hypothetical protein